MRVTELPEELLPEVVKTKIVTLAKLLKPKIQASVVSASMADANALAQEFGFAGRREMLFSQAFHRALCWLEEQGVCILRPEKASGRFTGIYRVADARQKLLAIDRSSQKIARARRRAVVRATLTRTTETDPKILKAVERRQETMNRRLVITEITRLSPQSLPPVERARR